MGNNATITGKIFFRDSGPAKSLGKPNHRLVMLVGIVAVPEDELPPLESFGVVLGNQASGSYLLAIRPTGEKHDTEGNSPDGILTRPFWQV